MIYEIEVQNYLARVSRAAVQIQDEHAEHFRAAETKALESNIAMFFQDAATVKMRMKSFCFVFSHPCRKRKVIAGWVNASFDSRPRERTRNGERERESAAAAFLIWPWKSFYSSSSSSSFFGSGKGNIHI